MKWRFSLGQNKYTYKDVSSVINVPVRTIQHWITESMLCKPEISEGRYKFFSNSQVKEIKTLKGFLKTLGYSTATIKSIRSKVLDEIGACGVSKYPLSALTSIVAGIFGDHPSDEIDVFIRTYLKDFFQLKINDQGMIYPSRDDIFENPFTEYRYFKNMEVFELDKEQFEENRGDLIRADGLERYFQEEYDYLSNILTNNKNKERGLITPKKSVEEFNSLIKQRLLYNAPFKHNGAFYISQIEIELAEKWQSLIYQAENPSFFILRNLKKTIEQDIIDNFPYALIYDSQIALSDTPQVKQLEIEVNLVKQAIVSVLKKLYEGTGNFIELYVEGFFHIRPAFCKDCRKVEPVFEKTLLNQLNPSQLVKAEKLGIYSTAEIIEESERRLKQSKEDIKFLRYRILRNLKRRKK